MHKHFNYNIYVTMGYIHMHTKGTIWCRFAIFGLVFITLFSKTWTPKCSLVKNRQKERQLFQLTYISGNAA